MTGPVPAAWPDELYAAAVEFARSRGCASISLLQRHFRIGFNRAARCIEQMDSEGLLGPQDGSKPRVVLMGRPADGANEAVVTGPVPAAQPDELYAAAVEFARSRGCASISLLQRHFRIGFNRAARCIEQMDSEGLLGPQDGSKPRVVLMGRPADGANEAVVTGPVPAAQPDELYAAAVEFVRTQGCVSISLLQRHFRIGFNRAVRCIEQMDSEGLLGPQDGSKPRVVLKGRG